MWRKLVITLSVVLTGVGAFVGASRAVRLENSDLPPGLPASVLPKAKLSDSTRLDLQNLLGSTAEAYGISTGSYENVRVLAQTAAGPLYVVPGQNGFCLALVQSTLPAASCGFPNRDNPVVAIFAPDSSASSLVGGGLTIAGIGGVSVKTPAGKSARGRGVTGGFAITPADGFSANDHVEVEAR